MKKLLLAIILNFVLCAYASAGVQDLVGTYSGTLSGDDRGDCPGLRSGLSVKGLFVLGDIFFIGFKFMYSVRVVIY